MSESQISQKETSKIEELKLQVIKKVLYIIVGLFISIIGMIVIKNVFFNKDKIPNYVLQQLKTTTYKVNDDVVVNEFIIRVDRVKVFLPTIDMIPEEGMKYISVDVTVINDGKYTQPFSPSIELTDNNYHPLGKAVDGIVDSSTGNQYLDSNIPVGRKKSFAMIFMVPQNLKKYKLCIKPSSTEKLNSEKYISIK